MRHFIFLPVFVPAAAMAGEGQGVIADLRKLDDPSRRTEEVARVVKQVEKTKILRGYRLLQASQRDGSGSLRVLVPELKYDFELEGGGTFDEYQIERPAELFDNGLEVDKASGLWSKAKADLDVIAGQRLILFDAKGHLIHPFGEHDEIRCGHLYDFNGDGILEFADNKPLEPIEVPGIEIGEFVLRTVEPIPRTLLRVIYNWHPEDYHEANEWIYTCHDEDRDGVIEIAFGPSNSLDDEELRQIVFRWDPATGSYSAGEIAPGAHIRILKEGETLADVKAAGGLKYEPIRKTDSFPDEEDPVDVSPPVRRPYVFQSLKDASDGDLISFFQGKEREDSFRPRGTIENRLPPGFWTMPPKQAALSFAAANRTAVHHRNWQLALDDRNGATPPDAGWIVYDWTSSGCYSLSTRLLAIRFGVDQPWLLATETNTNGAVGRNPLADQPGCMVRVVPLKREEADFMARTIFWLDRLRSRFLAGQEDGSIRGGSTADGSAELFLLPDRKKPVTLGNGFRSVSATRPISALWEAAYTPQVCINLTHYLLVDALPAYLGERWNLAPDLDRRSLTTSLEDRLKPRLDPEGREQLIRHLEEVLARHRSDPLPAMALSPLIRFVGTEAVLPLRGEMERIQALLPSPGKEDAEFKALEKRFGHIDSKSSPEEKMAEQRWYELQEKRKHELAPALREPLAATLKQLRMASDPKLLTKEAKARTNLSFWALDRLRKSYPSEWETSLMMEFRDADLKTKRNILVTLNAARPEAAKGLLFLMSAKETSDLLLEVTELENATEPGKPSPRVPAILALLKDTGAEMQRRMGAMELLSEMKLNEEQAREFLMLLLAELKKPQTHKDFSSMDTLGPVLEAMGRLPEAAAHLDEIQAVKRGWTNFSSGLEAIARLTNDRPDREERLQAFLRPAFTGSEGMLNGVFTAALAFDLKGLAPEIAGLASENPFVEDGEGANSSGGGFKNPVNERYHRAREVTAFWNETNPETLGRMWIAFAACQPYEFDARREPSQVTIALRKQAASAIRALPAEDRERAIRESLARCKTNSHRELAGKTLANMDSW